ncbi:MAG: hypothetical protein IJV15_00135 [Lachnospiraceae bacterium]|nr:hypothetical protein [Lachnospiraceae bacterium]
MKRKYRNMILLTLFIASCIDLGYVFLKLCWSIAGLSWFGVVTTLLSFTIASTTGEWLYDQMQ